MKEAGERARPRAVPTRPAGGSQVRAERTRAAIIDETVACVLEEGFSAASAKHIAERAGVTWGVIQYHFGDREGLLMAVVDTGYDQLRASFSTLEVATGPVRQRVEALVEAAWSVFSSPLAMAGFEIVVATRAQRDPRVTEHLVELGFQLRRLGRQIAVDADPAAQRAAADILWASLQGFTLAQMVMNEPLDFTHERAALVDVLVTYLDPA